MQIVCCDLNITFGLKNWDSVGFWLKHFFGFGSDFVSSHSTVIRVGWLWKVTSFKDKNSGAADPVGSSPNMHNPLFFVHKLWWNNLMRCFCKGFEPRSHFKSRLSLIVWVNVVLNRTLVDSDWHFDNLCGSHLQSQSELYHVSWWYYTLVIDLIG